MCGRYVTARSAAELADTFTAKPTDGADMLPLDFNVAPTKQVPIVVERSASERGDVQRQLRTARWGLVPSWAKNPSIGGKLINARAETATEKPAFRRALAARRCLLPADGYYEWITDPGGQRRPHFIHPGGEAGMAFAGLYELWRDDTRDADNPAAWLWSCTILTTAAHGSLADIHHRMPLIIQPHRQARWLDPNTSTEQMRELLAPPPVDRIRSYPVSTEVNNARNNGPHLLRPEHHDTLW